MGSGEKPIIQYAGRDLALRANWPAFASIGCALLLPIAYGIAPGQFDWFRPPTRIQSIPFYALWAIAGGAAACLGIMGIRRSSKWKIGGYWLGVAGLLFGSLNCVAVPMARAYQTQRGVYDYGITHSWMRCSMHMQFIGNAILVYSIDHGGHYPDNLDLLLQAGYPEPYFFVCDLSGTPPAPDGSTTLGSQLSYVYLGKGMTQSSDPKLVVLYEPISNHAGTTDDANFLFADGHVESFKASKARSMIRQLEAGQNPPSR